MRITQTAAAVTLFFVTYGSIQSAEPDPFAPPQQADTHVPNPFDKESPPKRSENAISAIAKRIDEEVKRLGEMLPAIELPSDAEFHGMEVVEVRRIRLRGRVLEIVRGQESADLLAGALIAHDANRNGVLAFYECPEEWADAVSSADDDGDGKLDNAECAALLFLIKNPKVGDAQSSRTGARLFYRDWSQFDSRAIAGDGLGPMHNDVSCVACHHQGGGGGGGEFKKNVNLLSVVRVSPRSTKRRARFEKRLATIHGALKGGAKSTVLHHFRALEGDAYQDWKKQLLAPRTRSSRPQDQRQAFRPFKGRYGMPLQVTQRNTTALFGAGLIESIPPSVLIEVAKRQPKIDPTITGRVPQTATGDIGRFGWRGQIATLQEFVETACAVELGLQVPSQFQAPDPTAPPQQVQVSFVMPSSTMTNLDLTQKECDALTKFVADLPRPTRRKPGHLEFAKLAAKGEEVFDRVGCSVCHVRDLGPVEGIYSDMLLHDMGPELADPVAAVPEMKGFGTTGVSYFGHIPTDNLVESSGRNRKTQLEWKTPPLWGVASSAPYLHDGRAATLLDAIALHGGEGRRSAVRFRSLPVDDQEAVLAFLNSLVSEAEANATALFGNAPSAFFAVE